MKDEKLGKNSVSGHWPPETRPIFLLPFDCYWEKSSGKEVLLHKAGSIGSIEKVDSLVSKKFNLVYRSPLQLSWLLTGLGSLRKFEKIDSKAVSSPQELQEWRLEFLNWVYPIFHEPQSDLKYLDLCFLCEQVFFNSSETLKQRFIQFPIEIQEKNFIAASIGVVLAIALGYCHKAFLEELFCAYLFFDAPYANEAWSNSEKEFFMKLWRGEVSHQDMNEENVKSYYEKSISCSKEIGEYFKYRRLGKYLSWSFERINGDGLFEGLKQEELSDLDCLSILIYHFCKGPPKMIDNIDWPLLNLVLTNEKDYTLSFISRRLERLLKSSFSESKSKDDDYIELIGL